MTVAKLERATSIARVATLRGNEPLANPVFGRRVVHPMHSAYQALLARVLFMGQYILRIRTEHIWVKLCRDGNRFAASWK